MLEVYKSKAGKKGRKYIKIRENKNNRQTFKKLSFILSKYITLPNVYLCVPTALAHVGIGETIIPDYIVPFLIHCDYYVIFRNKKILLF